MLQQKGGKKCEEGDIFICMCMCLSDFVMESEYESADLKQSPVKEANEFVFVTVHRYGRFEAGYTDVVTKFKRI